jgi:hypothetical protein
MKPMNAVAWRLKSIPTGYYEDKWLTWNTDWKQHDDAVLGKCGIEYAVPMPVPPSRATPPANLSETPVPINCDPSLSLANHTEIPSFDKWFRALHGGMSFRQVHACSGRKYEDFVFELAGVAQQYLTFAARFGR